MTIDRAPLGKELRVRPFSSPEDEMLSDIHSRLMHLGFSSGELIRVMRKPKFFKGPLLIEVRGRLVALTESEAQLVPVEVLS